MNTSALPCPTLVVAFGHKSGHGKDTAAAAIQAQFGAKYDIKRYAFADELRAEFYDVLLSPLHPYWALSTGYLLLPHPRNEFLSKADKISWIEENKAALGDQLQRYGTEYRRRQDPFYWVNLLRRAVSAEKPQVAFVTDLRFANEAYFVKAAQGLTVRVTRLGYVNPKRDPNHVSENELNTWLFDYEITVPLDSLSELQQDACTVFQMILDRQEPCLPEFGPDVVTQFCHN